MEVKVHNNKKCCVCVSLSDAITYFTYFECHSSNIELTSCQANALSSKVEYLSREKSTLVP